MKDMIYKDDAINALTKYMGSNYMGGIIDCIKNCTTIQINLNYGEWIPVKNNYNYPSKFYRCSCCKNVSEIPVGNFCQWCGTRMNNN